MMKRFNWGKIFKFIVIIVMILAVLKGCGYIDKWTRDYQLKDMPKYLNFHENYFQDWFWSKTPESINYSYVTYSNRACIYHEYQKPGVYKRTEEPYLSYVQYQHNGKLKYWNSYSYDTNTNDTSKKEISDIKEDEWRYKWDNGFTPFIWENGSKKSGKDNGKLDVGILILEESTKEKLVELYYKTERNQGEIPCKNENGEYIVERRVTTLFDYSHKSATFYESISDFNDDGILDPAVDYIYRMYQGDFNQIVIPDEEFNEGLKRK